MGKNKKKEVYAKNSQALRLKKHVKQSIIAMGIGGFLLIFTFALSLFSSSIEEERLETTSLLNQYRLASKTLTSNVQSFAVTADTQYYDAYLKELNEDKNRDIAWEELQKNHINDEEWTSLEEIAALSDGLVPLEEAAFAAAKSGDTDTAIASVFGAEYTDTVSQINSKTDTAISQIQERIGKKTKQLSVLQIVIEVFFILSFLYVAYQIMCLLKFAHQELLLPIKKVSSYLSIFAQGNFHEQLDLPADESEVGTMVSSINFMKGNLVGIINEISSILEQMGEGNYLISIQQNYIGEFQTIKHSLTTICEKMQETFKTIRDVSQQVNVGSEQLANAATDLAEGCTVQANKVSEIVTLTDDLYQSLECNATEANDSVELAMNAGKIMMNSNSHMTELKIAIGEINQCSEQIRSIINAINDIASQTNLLALNAAIEAARAGEAGKGFAVVAEQVKTLAEESSKAAGETTKLIESTVAAVDKGIRIADTTSANMEEVLASAQAATEKMGQISTMLNNNVTNLQQINSNLTSVSEIVDNNSASSEETAAVSQQQSAQVETMVSLLDKFQV